MPDEPFQEQERPPFYYWSAYFPSSPQSVRRKNIAPDSRNFKSERYSFVCVLRVDRLPGLDNPMQSPRRLARFPAVSTPAGEPCLFRCRKSHVPDAPIRFQDQGHGRPASYFQGRSFRPPQRCLHRHLPKPKPRQAHHSRGLCCLPITSAFSFAISCLYLGSVIAIMVGD